MIRQPGPFPHVCYRHALDCIYLLPSGGGLDSRWSIVVASAAAGGMSPSQRPRTSAARRARSRRPTDGRWRVGGAGCGGAGPRAAAARVEGESGFESARGRAAPTSGRSPSRATAGSASRSGRFVARCVAPSSANGARQSGHRMQPSTPPVDACARARARHSAHATWPQGARAAATGGARQTGHSSVAKTGRPQAGVGVGVGSRGSCHDSAGAGADPLK